MLPKAGTCPPFFLSKENMKKILRVSSFLALALALTLTGCKPKLKNVHVYVTKVDLSGDTLKGFTGRTVEDSIKFSVDQARFNNGVMYLRDSVIVDYIDGKNDTARALVVTVLPKNGKVLDLDTMKNNKLKTVSPKKVNKKLEY